MKKLTVVTLLFVSILMSLQSCRKVIGDGPVVTETRTTRTFSEVDFGVPGEMIFEEADDVDIIIEAQRNIIDVIETYVSGNELRIRVRDNRHIRSSEDIRIIVKAPGVSSLAVSGSGRLDVPGLLAATHTSLRVSGSGRLMVQDIDTDDLDTRISGSGSIEVLTGNAEREEISISGSGDVNLLGVTCRSAETQTSGSGNIRLHVLEELEVRISGSGDVFYQGNPSVNVSVSGSGKLVKL